MPKTALHIILSIFFIASIGFYFGCKKSKSTGPSGYITKMGTSRIWRGTVQYGWWEPYHQGTGQFYSYFEQNFADTFAFVVNSDSEVSIVKNAVLNIDTSVFKLYQKDAITMRFVLTRNVNDQPAYPFSPYNTYPDSIIYYYIGDSIKLFSGDVNGGYYADFISMATP